MAGNDKIQQLIATPGPAGPAGPAGPTGPAGANGTNASAANWRGDYAAGTTYAQGDGVRSTVDSNLYVSKVGGNVGHEPSASPTYWQGIGTAGLGDPGANGIIKRTALNTTGIAVAGTEYAVPSPVCTARRSGAGGNNQTIPSSAWTVLQFDAEIQDTDGFHSTVSNVSRFTIPAGLDGTYLVVSNAGFVPNANGARHLSILKNGAGYYNRVSGITSSTEYSYMATSGVLVLAAGDYVELVVYQSSGGNLDILSNDGLAVWPQASIIKIR